MRNLEFFTCIKRAVEGRASSYFKRGGEGDAFLGPGATNKEHFNFSRGEFKDPCLFTFITWSWENFPIWFWITTLEVHFHSYSMGVQLGWEFMEEWDWEISAYDIGYQWAHWKSKPSGVSEEFLQARLPIPTEAAVRSRVPFVPRRLKNSEGRKEGRENLPA